MNVIASSSRYRWLIAAGLATSVLAAGCGNDAATTGSDAETPSESSSAASPEEEAEPIKPAVTLEELCESDYSDIEAPKDFKAGLVTDVGTVTDGSFNQFAYEGLKAAEECFGIETDFIETANQADYNNNLTTILSREPDAVVTTGFLLADATLAYAKDNPGVSWIGIDQFQEAYPDNYVGILFREDQGGYLAGALAALLTESNVIGVVAGREDVPPVVRYVNGYETGAKSINPDIEVLRVYNSSFDDPAKGASDAKQMIGEGADVIFGAGGITGSGGVRAAAESGAWAVGVDQDQYATIFGSGSAEGADRIASSAVKRVDLGVFTQIAAAIEGDFKGGIFQLTAENDGITYAPPHDADIPVEVSQRLEEIRSGLADGSIDTGVDPVTGELL
ncbi:MAG: BMP family ABC transporter substrate-binding protein [Nocardioidaceae bacterium]